MFVNRQAKDEWRQGQAVMQDVASDSTAYEGGSSALLRRQHDAMKLEQQRALQRALAEQEELHQDLLEQMERDLASGMESWHRLQRGGIWSPTYRAHSFCDQRRLACRSL